MRRGKPLGPGKKSAARGSTFKAKPRKQRDTTPDKLDVEAILRDNPRQRHGRRESRAPGAAGWTSRVFALHGRICLVCGNKRAVHAHHIVPARTIEAREGVYSPLIYDQRNGMPVCYDCHMAHERPAANRGRIPFDRIPRLAVQWAVAHGFDWYLSERVYPRG
jgi:hypothetical protein